MRLLILKLVVLSAFALVPFVVVHLLVRAPRRGEISAANARAIRYGMTREEVEEILGPQRDTTMPGVPGRVRMVLSAPTTEEREWLTENTAITVDFDRQTGRVAHVWYEQSDLWELKVWEKLDDLRRSGRRFLRHANEG